MKRKNIIILVATLLLLVVVSILFVSFAYVSNVAVGNETSSKTVFKRSTMKVEFSGGSESITNNSNNFNPGAVLTKTFSLKNIGDKDVTYDIKLSDVKNDFNRKNDISYELYINDQLISSNVFPSVDTTIKSNENIKTNEKRDYTLIIKYNQSDENQIVDSGKIISAKIDFNESIQE